jgi:hypothetical protein
MQANVDLSVLTLVVTVVMAILQMAVLVWKGGELSHRVTSLESRVGTLEVNMGNLKTDVSELKAEFRADIAFIKGVLSGWKNNYPPQDHS